MGFATTEGAAHVVQAAALEVRGTTSSAFNAEAATNVAIGAYSVSGTAMKTSGVGGCLGIVMHRRGATRGGVGHAFDHAGNTQQSVPAAKTMVNQMIAGLGGNSANLDLLLFNGGGIDNATFLKSGFIAWVLAKGWMSIQDKSARTTGTMATSSFVLYYPQNGLAYIQG